MGGWLMWYCWRGSRGRVGWNACGKAELKAYTEGCRLFLSSVMLDLIPGTYSNRSAQMYKVPIA